MKSAKKESKKFREFPIQVGGAWKRMAVISCSICREESQINIKSASGYLVPEAQEKKFASQGWYVGHNDTKHICPQCISNSAKRPVISLVKNNVEEVAEVKNVPAVVFNPKASTSALAAAVSSTIDQKVGDVRIMQREDRRIIFEKLNDVYLDDKRGYDNGWSDHKVSVDLGTPRAWVEQVREEMFGPVATNPEIAEFLALKSEVEALRNEVASLSAMRGQMINIDSTFKKIDLARLMDRLNHIEKIGEEVKKHIP